MSQLIVMNEGRASVVEDDAWHGRTDDGCSRGNNVPVARILSLADYQDAGCPADAALRLAPDDDPDQPGDWLLACPLIILEFPRFTDGRAYSQAAILRRQRGYRGDLRATGDVLRDQLGLMLQCGFSSFLIRADKSAVEALAGLQHFRYRFAEG